MHEKIADMMRQLRLGGMARRWEEVSFETPEQYVSALLSVELREREANRANKLTKAGGFPKGCRRFCLPRNGLLHPGPPASA